MFSYFGRIVTQETGDNMVGGLSSVRGWFLECDSAADLSNGASASIIFQKRQNSLQPICWNTTCIQCGRINGTVFLILGPTIPLISGECRVTVLTGREIQVQCLSGKLLMHQQDRCMKGPSSSHRTHSDTLLHVSEIVQDLSAEMQIACWRCHRPDSK